jgi:DNA repair exonuclease SbcCD ATPase subunit
MILFKVIRYKNFLSTGNVFTEIPLNKDANTLIIGSNGAGKSTILDALTFALFGKAFRKINKPLLINSVNGKEAVVEIEFDVNGKQYKVIRGIKPNIFEIYCNGTLLNQDSASKDYQVYLEKFILMMNYKSFVQIVVLGSASFTPFMQLSAADRRAIIEDLLDIEIFTTMNVIAKQRMQVNRELLEKNRVAIAGKEEKKVYIEKTINNLKQNNEEKKSDLLAQLQQQMETLANIKKCIDDLEKERDVLLEKASDNVKSKEKHKKLISLQSKIETNLQRTQKEKSFYDDNDSCPTCRQTIDVTFKAVAVETTNKKIEEYETGLQKIVDEIAICIEHINETDRLITKSNNIRNDVSSQKAKMSSIISSINDLEDQIEKLGSSDSMMLDSINELETTTNDLKTLSNEREQLLEEKLYVETAINLLKDGGIKTKIIKQYLPIINKLINKYLSQMGFFVNFNINEQFEETIKSRYRDEFSYQNFSEGEKMRIDLAILFAWRTIAKMKNSINTNLLILDEVFDSSLDVNGTDEFLKIMWNLTDGTNTFVISHKTDALLDKFSRVIRFEKHKNFSRIAA